MDHSRSNFDHVLFDDKNRPVGISTGIGDRYGAYRQKPNGTLQRMTTRALPQSKDKEVVRRALIAYASQRIGWRWKEGAFLR